MRTEQLVRRMPESARLALAEELGVSASHDPVGALIGKIVSPDYNRDSITHMRPWEKETLLHIVKGFASLPFEQNRLEAGAPCLSGAHIRAGLIRLQRKGIIFALRKSWGEFVYVLPEDALGSWCSILLPGGLEAWNSDSPEVTVEGGEQRSGLAHDLFRLLVYISKNEVTATQKGSLQKRHIQKLSDLFALKDADFEGMELAYAHHDAYGPALAVVLDTALRFGLLRFEDRMLLPVPEAVRGWIAKPIDAMQEELLNMWLGISRPDSGRQMVLLAKLVSAKAGVWYDLEQFYDWIARYGIMETTEHSAAAAFLQTQIRLLESMGWLETGITSGGRQVFRRRSFYREDNGSSPGDASKAFYVQSDFEIIVPPGASYAVLWELEAMAERLQDDGLSVYRLTKESIRFALENGRDAAVCIDFLETYGYYGVPEHVKSAVREWARQYGTVTVSQMLVVTCNDRETTDLIGSLPECRPFIGERLGERHYVVLSGQAEPFILILERMGYFPRNIVSLPDATGRNVRKDYPVLTGGGEMTCSPADISVLPEPGQASQNGFLFPGLSDLPYPLAPQLPSSEQLVPDLQSVPSIWLKEFRSYHASTQKDMIRKAIEWRTLLRIKSGGTEWEVVPCKLQEHRETWELVGLRDSAPVSLEAGQWEEMKLVLPGIND